jgi:murein DD-endopeptidase MepM/ murein hydrolase activator NlpD
VKSGKRVIFLPCALVLTLVFVLTPFVRISYADELTDKLQEMQQLENEIQEYKNQIESRKKTENSLINEIQKLDDQIFLAEKELAYIQAQISYVGTEIKETERQIQETEAQLAAQKSAFDSRLVSIYKSRMVSYVDVLLTSTSLSDLLSRMHYLREIASQDVVLMEEYSAARAQLVAEKETLEQRMAELSDLKVLQENKRQEAISASAQREEYLAGIQADRQRLEQALDEMERQSRELEKIIKDLQAQMGLGPKDTLSMSWPATGGWISSYYGSRMHPVLGYPRFHAGIDYAIGMGHPIKAAEDGTVILSGSNGGYGLCVIIDHGGGISTLYGHASKLLVSWGQQVKKGDTIALAGSTGVSTGPHLHFEVRIDGVPDDPLKWLP